MHLLQVENISLEEAGNSALKDISFTVAPQRKIAIAGETGSGKSTLLQIIAGLVQPTAGKVTFQGQSVIGPQDKLIPGHPGIVYLSQQFELPKFLRVEQALRYANKLPTKEAGELYDLCRINHLLQRRTDHLSGGECQRIAIARLLLTSPQLFLLDEPFSNLDMGHKKILKEIIREVSEKLAITLLLISHDPLDTLSWADEILVMKEGKILQSGSPEYIYNKPLNEYVASLFGTYNLIPAALTNTLPGINNEATKLLIRPEHVQLESENSGGLPGLVKQITYFGSYSELEVMLGEIVLTVKTKPNLFQKGEVVYISIALDKTWQIV